MCIPVTGMIRAARSMQAEFQTWETVRILYGMAPYERKVIPDPHTHIDTLMRQKEIISNLM